MIAARPRGLRHRGLRPRAAPGEGKALPGAELGGWVLGSASSGEPAPQASEVRPAFSSRHSGPKSPLGPAAQGTRVLPGPGVCFQSSFISDASPEQLGQQGLHVHEADRAQLLGHLPPHPHQGPGQLLSRCTPDCQCPQSRPTCIFGTNASEGLWPLLLGSSVPKWSKSESNDRFPHPGTKSYKRPSLGGAGRKKMNPLCSPEQHIPD